MKQSFRTKLVARGPGGAWTFLHIPFDVEATFGTKARVPVSGTINGFPFRNSLMPEGDGTHSMMVNKTLQEGARARAGGTVSVEMTVDRRTRVVRPPRELADVLAANIEAAKIYRSLSPSHRREFADWVRSAKQESTRKSRAQKSLGLILKSARVR